MRKKFKSILRRYLRSPLPGLFACGALLMLFVAGVSHIQNISVLTTVISLSAVFVFGYSLRMRKEYPYLHEYRRSEYAAVWNELSCGEKESFKAATGHEDEEGLRITGTQVASRITSRIGVKKTDDVLELGCGVGRIGWAIAPLCHAWTGADISKNMLDHAKTRLGFVPNVRLVQLRGVRLDEIPSESVDVVYCTNVLPHLSETDRWSYLADAYRVLRQEGRLYIDTIALDSAEGWAMLQNNISQRETGRHAPYEPTPSTAEEFVAYFRHAGFGDVRVELEDSILIVKGVKHVKPDALGAVASLPGAIETAVR